MFNIQITTQQHTAFQKKAWLIFLLTSCLITLWPWLPQRVNNHCLVIFSISFRTCYYLSCFSLFSCLFSEFKLVHLILQHDPCHPPGQSCFSWKLSKSFLTFLRWGSRAVHRMEDAGVCIEHAFICGWFLQEHIYIFQSSPNHCAIHSLFKLSFITEANFESIILNIKFRFSSSDCICIYQYWIWAAIFSPIWAAIFCNSEPWPSLSAAALFTHI